MTLKKISKVILIAILVLIFSLFWKIYLLSIATGILLIFLFLKWYQLISEELVIYHVIQNSCKVKYDYIIELLGEKIKASINRLKRKGIIEQLDDFIILKQTDYRCYFFRKGKRK